MCGEETLAWATGGENCSTNLGGSLGTNGTNLDGNHWVIDIVEPKPDSTSDTSPFFTKGVNSNWDAPEEMTRVLSLVTPSPLAA